MRSLDTTKVRAIRWEESIHVALRALAGDRLKASLTTPEWRSGAPRSCWWSRSPPPQGLHDLPDRRDRREPRLRHLIGTQLPLLWRMNCPQMISAGRLLVHVSGIEVPPLAECGVT